MSVSSLDNLKNTERFANIVIGKLNLLIPQTDIYSLEPALDIKSVITKPNSIGQLEQGGKIWPLYALSEDLELLTKYLETYRIAILMKHITPHYGLLCEQVYTVERNAISIYPIPPAIDSQHSPLLALALYGEEVRCLSSAATLQQIFHQES